MKELIISVTSICFGVILGFMCGKPTGESVIYAKLLNGDYQIVRQQETLTSVVRDSNALPDIEGLTIGEVR